MERVRRRMAVGIFATVAEVELVIGRLNAIGVSRSDCVLLAADLSPSEPAQRGTALDDLPGPAPGQIMLRVPLAGKDAEQAVASVLLSSAARSVQLHDLD